MAGLQVMPASGFIPLQHEPCSIPEQQLQTLPIDSQQGQGFGGCAIVAQAASIKVAIRTVAACKAPMGFNKNIIFFLSNIHEFYKKEHRQE